MLHAVHSQGQNGPGWAATCHASELSCDGSATVHPSACLPSPAFCVRSDCLGALEQGTPAHDAVPRRDWCVHGMQLPRPYFGCAPQGIAFSCRLTRRSSPQLSTNHTRLFGSFVMICFSQPSTTGGPAACAWCLRAPHWHIQPPLTTPPVRRAER